MGWRTLPLGIGALAMAACSALLLANLAMLAVGRTPMKLFPGLTGVFVPPPLPTTLDAVADGRFQAAAARRIGSEMPLYPVAVRLRNQLAYSVFGDSANPVILVGRQGALIERPYAEDYCSRDLASWRPGALEWAAGIRQMQDEQARRGKAFLYVLTPSKVAQYPGLLPQGFTCPSSPADRTAMVPQWIAMLHDAGVNLVDTTAVLRAAQADYPFPLFPPGGTHWNAVGAALAQQAVVSALAGLLPDAGFVPSPFAWQMRAHPVPNTDDVDLARLMNLIVPVANGPVPAVTPQPAPPPGVCLPRRVVIVGGSFSHATLQALRAMPCPVTATEYEYWHNDVARWNNGELDREFHVDPAARAADVLAADVLLYEENEELLRHPDHGRALWTFLRQHATHDPR